MNFNPDSDKQAQEIIFSIYFDNRPLKLTQTHKHLVAIGLLRKIQLILKRHSLITIY